MVGAEAALVDGQGPAIERLRLGQPVRVPEQLGQVVELGGHIGVVGAEAALVDGQGPAIERLGLGVQCFGMEENSQAVR